MKIVVEVKSRYTDQQIRSLIQAISEQGSFSHSAYAELQGRDARLIVEIVGVVTERQEVSYDLFGNESSYPVDVIEPLEGS